MEGGWKDGWKEQQLKDRSSLITTRRRLSAAGSHSGANRPRGYL